VMPWAKGTAPMRLIAHDTARGKEVMRQRGVHSAKIMYSIEELLELGPPEPRLPQPPSAQNQPSRDCPLHRRCLPFKWMNI